MNDWLDVTLGFEVMALASQLGSQGLEVVDFAVANQMQGLGFIGQGLAACVEVDDGKTTEGEGDPVMRVVIYSCIIRAPMGQALGHFLRLVDISVTTII